MSPGAVVTYSNKVRIVFQSNGRNNGDGFSANWSRACGGTFNSEAGELVSPGYPVSYDNNLNCVYLITAPNQDYIVATFADLFDVEWYRPHGRRCRYDRVLVQELSAATPRTRGTFCGSETPPAMSARKAMKITFTTDYSVTKRGFKLTWTRHPCGGEMTEPGEFQSPVHPDNYFHNSNCTWIITAPADRAVEIK